MSPAKPSASVIPRGLIVPIFVAQFLTALDFSSMALVVSLIGKGSHADPATLQWIISACSLAFGGCLILGGRIADIVGHRRIFVIGTALFLTGAAISLIGLNIGMIIVGRALSGLGSALYAPAILAALVANVPEGAARHRAFSLYSVAQALGSALGVTMGGALATVIGWRAIFLLDILVATSALISAASLPATSGEPRAREVLDFAGAALVTVGCALLVLACSLVGKYGFGGKPVIEAAAAAFVALVAFLLVERRAISPIVPLSLFRIPGLPPALLVSMATNATTAGLFLLLAIFLHQTVGLNPGEISLTFLPKIVGVFIAAALIPRLLKQWLSPRAAMTLGCGFTGAIMFALTGITTINALPLTIVAVTLIPFGQMAAIIATTGEATGRAPPTQRGVTSAVLLAGNQIGVAVAMGIYASALQFDALPGHPNVPAGFIAAGSVAAFGTLVALLAAKGKRLVVTA